EDGPAIEADAGYACDGEFDRQYIALLARWIIAWRAVHRGHGAVGKSLCIEPRSFFSVLVVPDADGVLGLDAGHHVSLRSITGFCTTAEITLTYATKMCRITRKYAVPSA